MQPHSAIRPVLALLLCAAATTLSAQTLPTRQEAQDLYREIPGLMEASAIIVPELARAGAPLTENVKQASRALLGGDTTDHVALMYTLLTNARVYVQIVDALPKPPAFSDNVRQQIEQLRLKTDQLDVYFRHVLDLRQNQLRSTDRDNLQRYSEANRNLLPPAQQEQRVVFFGDSITDGWPLDQYFPSKPYVNRGISGQITGQMLGRLQADVIDLQPRVMVFLGGTNDLARGVSLSAIQDNIGMIADLAAANGIRPVLAALLPVSDHHQETNPRFRRTVGRPPQDILDLNAWIKTFAAARGFVYLDYHQPLVDQQGMFQRDLADDGLHPNSEGYKVMGPLVEQSITQALAETNRRNRKRLGIF